MVNVIKAFAYVSLNNPVFSRCVRYLIDARQRHRGITHGPKPVRMLKELCFQNRFQHNFYTLLYDAVSNSRYAQRTFLGFSWFVDIFPAYLLNFKVLKCVLNILNYPLIGSLQIVLSRGFEIYTGSLTAVIAFDVVNCCDNGCFC